MTRETRPIHLERTLIYIPIVHTPADMGALREKVRQKGLQRMGPQGWRRKISIINNLWSEIERTVEGIDLTYKKVLIYQDGLPVCGREVEIVRDLAKAGSRNYHLLLRLMEKGAQIMGTESAELLVEEYELNKQILDAGEKLGPSRMGVRQKALSDELLKRRDQFISHRINTTLKAGETGILFLGILHSLGNLLAKDIEVIYPIHLSNRGGQEDDRTPDTGPDCR